MKLWPRRAADPVQETQQARLADVQRRVETVMTNLQKSRDELGEILGKLKDVDDRAAGAPT